VTTTLTDPTTTTPTTTTDRARLTATLVAAFAADPVIRWTFPDAATYLGAFPALLGALGGAAFDDGTADEVADHAGCALWLAPGTTLDVDAIGGLIGGAVAPERLEELGAFLEQVGEHHPEGDHWYLPFVGVDPATQGLGYGSELLRHGLARADRDQVPTYLEASSPRNRALYERHGFRAVAEIRTTTSPPLWPMWRHPTSGGAS
jgi:ribosomal protein S18 acetylase RimI-like enzyme